MSTSYSRILRTSAITGGAAGMNMLISMVSVKFGAVLLGPAGIGQLRVFQALLGFASSLSGLGIHGSAVQSIAKANADGRADDLAATVSALRRTSWVLGLTGWVLLAALAWPVSEWAFGDTTHGSEIALLGACLLLSSLSALTMALFQGYQRIGDLARINVTSAALSTGCNIAWFAGLGQGGIVPSLLCTAAISALVPRVWSSRLPRHEIPPLPWRETLREATRLSGLGTAMMVAGLASSLTGFLIPAIVNRELGVDAVGLYAAAWGISGLFANFILGAMGADYFPRLSAVASDRTALNRLVNEQTEIGILLALPGLAATIGFAPLAIQFFYTKDFAGATSVLLWFSIGIFGRVTSWPLGFLLLARRDALLFVASELIFGAMHVGLVLACVRLWGLAGVGIAFFALYAIYNIAMLIVARVIADVNWNASTWRIALPAACLVAAAAATRTLIADPWSYVASFAVAVLAGIIALRGLMARLGPDHRVSQVVARVPGLGRIACFPEAVRGEPPR
jgi:antigen flippase